MYDLDLINANQSDFYSNAIGDCGLPPACLPKKMVTRQNCNKIFGKKICINVPTGKFEANKPCIEKQDKYKRCMDAKAKKLKAGIKKTVKDIGQNIQRTSKEIGQNIERTTKEIIQNKDLKKALKGVFLTYNPAIAVPRSSALLSFRVNLFGISSRLYPAFLDEATLKKGNFNLENAANAKKAWEKIANFWEDKLGGDRNKLREAISGAWNKPIFKTKKAKERKRSTSFDGYSDVSGYDDAAYAAYISAGLSIIGGIVGIVNDSKAKKNPYNEGTPEYNKAQSDINSSDTTPPPINEAELNKMIDAAKSDMAKGLPKDSTGIDATGSTGEEKVDSQGRRVEDTILGMPKPVAIGLGVLILAVGGYFVYKKFIKK